MNYLQSLPMVLLIMETSVALFVSSIKVPASSVKLKLINVCINIAITENYSGIGY